MTITLAPLSTEHEADFLDAVARSRDLHHPWVAPPATPQAFRVGVAKTDRERHHSFLALNGSSRLVGCINLNEVVHGAFQSAYMGYYAFAPFAGKGLMKQAMTLAIHLAFDRLGLHRLEANIQPGNAASRALVQSLGFRHEGFSPRYLKINGQWRDHERYAITTEDWKPDPSQTHGAQQ
ncbi:MAG: GNAT family N-acetyltransferase [Phycisphaerales bacterium JB063]